MLYLFPHEIIPPPTNEILLDFTACICLLSYMGIKVMQTAFILLLALMLVLPAGAIAQSGKFAPETIETEYPADIYMVGIGKVKRSSSPQIDIRTAELQARTAIGSQIKARIKEETVTQTCEDTDLGRMHSNMQDCKEALLTAVEETVSETLSGCRIAKQGVEEGYVYIVAVLPRENTLMRLTGYMSDAILQTKSKLCEVNDGKTESISEAVDYYTKAMLYEQEKDAIEGVHGNPSAIFKELGNEILSLK